MLYTLFILLLLYKDHTIFTLIILFKVTSEEKERKSRKYFFEKVKDAKTFSKKKSIISPGNLPFLVIIFKK